MTQSNYHLCDCYIQFVKTHRDAKLPERAHDGDNCFDVFAVEDTVVPAGTASLTKISEDEWKGPLKTNIGHAVVPIGLKVGSITPGYGFVIRPKSGLGFKHGLQPHLGEIDNGYRGDCGIKMYNFSNKAYTFKKGDKVAQLKIEKIYKTQFAFTLEEESSERGEGGFGSTGQ